VKVERSLHTCHCMQDSGLKMSSYEVHFCWPTAVWLDL